MMESELFGEVSAPGPPHALYTHESIYMPTFLVQDYVDVLLPFLTMMCNCSIRESQLPSSQKRSILHPVLKREGLDQTDPGNYRPIANVSFISKILERIIASQLVAYSDAYD